MTVRTPLDLEDARKLLQSYGLKLLHLLPLLRGTINSNYRVDTDAGLLFLRINEGKTLQDVRFETDLIWHLGSRGLPTPQLWRTLRGEPFALLPGQPDKAVMLFQWAEGQELSEDQIGEHEARSTGAILGKLHRAGESFPRTRPGIYTLPHVQARVERLHADPRVPDGIVEHLQRESTRLSGSRDPDLPVGLGHGDLFPDNLLFSKSGRKRDAAWVLDLEQAATLPYAYDLSVALLSFCAPPTPETPETPETAERIGPILLSLGRALLQGYQEVRPLSPRERLGMYEEARFAALRFTVTRLTDIHLRRGQAKEAHQAKEAPGVPVHSKDYRDYLRRMELLAAAGAERFVAALPGTCR